MVRSILKVGEIPEGDRPLGSSSMAKAWQPGDSELRDSEPRDLEPRHPLAQSQLNPQGLVLPPQAVYESVYCLPAGTATQP